MSNCSQQNNKFKTVLNDIAKKMPSVNIRSNNPIETLSIEDLAYLQKYIEYIKNQKIYSQKKLNTTSNNKPNIPNNKPNIPNNKPNILINRANEIYDPIGREVPIDWRNWKNNTFTPNMENNNLEPGCRGSSSTRMGKRSQYNNTINDYHNPYEYGARQDSLQVPINEPYIGPYDNDSCKNMSDYFPDHIRNINVESSLMQREMTHLPGQREITEKDYDRFQLLPFDPQDHKHIVWTDNMPRGGYSTRSNRLED
ncbi:hypothetical protein QKC54_gp0395 [Megavirus baoshan]|uniref:Uncharacterized protein n=1 Tax=Megavirus baoshan TaxID=2496520 RepID=A0A3S8UX93_9VIRU|nr:hypothetical protein QKC54_gp0395 [Megavirus baoshan]AZL89430.1 hypothetical protein Mb0677 [Megavirus baoshan]